MESESNRIYRELISEDSSLWYIADDSGSKIMIKLPSTAIKSIITGCKVQFLFGRDGAYFHIGIRVYDDEINYLSVTGLSRFREEHRAVMTIFSNESTIVEFYNELDACFVRTRVSFANEVKNRVIQMLGDVSKLYVGELDSRASASLDSFEFSLNKEREIDEAHEIDVYVAEGEFSDFTVMENYFLGAKDTFKIEINDQDEGELLERLVWASLEPLFMKTLFKNPQLSINNRKRELTDILAFYERGVFLIESKSLSVTSLEKARSMDRKIDGIQKQVEKGIKQLTGALNALRRNEDISDSRGNKIILDRGVIPHCIVLVSDLFPIGNWSTIEVLMLNTIKNACVFLNVIDLKEFLKHLKASRGDPQLLDYHLIKRTELFVRNRNIYIESKLR